MANIQAVADHPLTIHEQYEALFRKMNVPLVERNDRRKADGLFGAHVVDFLGADMPWGSYGRVAIQAFRPAQPCIYFIGGDEGAIKIGTTIAPLERLASFQLGSPIKLRIMALALGDRAVERQYHTRFSGVRAHGEWFDRCPQILAEIEKINRQNAWLKPKRPTPSITGERR